MNANYSSTDRTYSGSFVQQNFATSGINGQFPVTPVVFPKLREMSVGELHTLGDSEEKQEEFLKELPELIQLSKLKDEYMKKNDELARENVMEESVIENTRKKLLETLEEANNLKREFDEASQLYDMLADAYSPTSLQERLQVAALEAEEESDKIAEDFLEDHMKVDEFLRKFTEKRVLYHQRQAKKEKLSQQLLAMNRSHY